MTSPSLPPWLIADPAPTEFYTDERCFITELLNSAACPQVSLALARVQAGVTTRLHCLNGVTETYVLRKGHGIVQVDGVERAVGTGDRVVIAAGVSQRISNTGSADLEFYCVCTPRFTPACYIDLENPDPST